MTPQPNKPRILGAFIGSGQKANMYLPEILSSHFESMFAPTDIEISLFGGWSAVAYQPQKGTNHPSWAYKIFHNDELQDYGLINWSHTDSQDEIDHRQQRQVINYLTDVTQCFRDQGVIPRIYGTSMMDANSSQ